MPLQPALLRSLRYLSGFLPGQVRGYLRRHPEKFSLRKPLDIAACRSRRSYVGKHVIVAGHYASATGLGKAADLVARTLQRRGAVVTRVDLTAALGMSVSTGTEAMPTPADCAGIDATDIVLVLNPGMIGVVLHHFDRKWLLNRSIIAHWIWEIERMPAYWAQAAASYDEIWAPTEFSYQALQQLLPDFPGAIRLLPYTIDFQLFPAPSLQQRSDIRHQLGIPSSAFVAGYSFACGSNYQRKNPEAAVDQFRSAFAPDDDTVKLVLRCRDLNRHREESSALRRKIAGDSRVLLFDDENHLGIEEFYAAIDLYLSPSRAEGFGLNLVEASQLGIPVITSGWRLPRQVAQLPLIHAVDYDLIPIVDPQGQYAAIEGGRWSEPRLESVVGKLRALREERRNRSSA